jgi:dihydrofolate reductase
MPEPIEGDTMSKVRVHNFSISIDGFGTGEGLTLDAPFGHAGERLHEWMFKTKMWTDMIGETGGNTGVDNAFAVQHGPGIGAEIMGRGKFGPPHQGPWTNLGTDEEWRGWWGPNPPFHTPVFVMTHHTRPSFSLSDTTFHFVNDDPATVLKQAQAAAEGKDVRIGGGATTVREFLDAGLVDTMHVAIADIELGSGARLWESPDELDDRFHHEVVPSPTGLTTHHLFWRR